MSTFSVAAAHPVKTPTTTNLFRETSALRIIKEALIPEILSHQDGVIITSVGCSQGDELTSILLHNWDNREKFKLVGIDADPGVLNLAKKGCLASSPDHVFQYVAHAKKQGIIASDEALSQILELRDGQTYIRSEGLKHLHYLHLNPLLAPLPENSDITLFSNILMHYDVEQGSRLLSNALSQTHAGGYVFIVDKGDEAKTIELLITTKESFGSRPFVRLDPASIMKE